MVERHALELERLVGGRERLVPVALVPEVGQRHRALQRRHLGLHALDQLAAVMVLAAVAVAVDRQQHLRLDLGEAVDDAARAEVGRAARPDRAEAGGGEEGGDRLGDVRHVGDDAVAALDAERLQAGGDAGGLVAQLVPGPLAELAQLGGMPDRDAVARAVAEDVLGIGELGAREPLRARHRGIGEHLVVAALDVEELPDRAPEGLELLGRPPPERVVVVEGQAALLLEPAHVARHRRALAQLIGRLPEEGPLLLRRHRRKLRA